MSDEIIFDMKVANEELERIFGGKMSDALKIKEDRCYFCDTHVSNIVLNKIITNNKMFYWICINCDEENYVDYDDKRIFQDKEMNNA